MATFYLILFFSYIIVGGFFLIPVFPKPVLLSIPTRILNLICGCKFPLGIDGILSMWYSSQYVCRYESSTFLLRFFLSDFSFHSSLPVCLDLDKAYSMGTVICHTTNILNCCFCYIVQWIKPPLLLLSNLFSNPFLVRMLSYLFWIEFIISHRFRLVNTIL